MGYIRSLLYISLPLFFKKKNNSLKMYKPCLCVRQKAPGCLCLSNPWPKQLILNGPERNHLELVGPTNICIQTSEDKLKGTKANTLVTEKGQWRKGVSQCCCPKERKETWTQLGFALSLNPGKLVNGGKTEIKTLRTRSVYFTLPPEAFNLRNSGLIM